ncbi:helix-turn-helix domain-containing protein [Bacillus cereus]|uniref:helix-turn-helix domain-containing protein n=1 Tax=Bacillus cereus TaxID=1396 RepID=UPI0018F693A5|nr:helix-turn-helix transcriptional regulator [Bacillus cereus]MBJ8024914.1 helix-turn-helix transcriptional regulator [Bacillus cereus]MBJ8037414.1 helix-turn-helix transcriptional regulator [Bacillus cereus]
MIINNVFLREIRKEKGLTQNQLANLLGLDKTSISKYESGIHSPSLRVLVLYANIFGTQIENFLKRS